MSEHVDYCHLCGHPVEPRRWRWLGARWACKDESACRNRFVSAFARGKVRLPSNPSGRYVTPEVAGDE